MASIRKRTWTTAAGETRIAWQLSWVEWDGERKKNVQRKKQFKTRRAADNERIVVEGTADAGGTPGRVRTVGEAAKAFLIDFQKLAAAGRRAWSTLKHYRVNVEKHIERFDIVAAKLPRTHPEVLAFAENCAAFAEALEDDDLSGDKAAKIFKTLRTIVKHAVGRGWACANPAESIVIRTDRQTGGAEDDAPVVIPSKQQCRALIEAAAKRHNRDGGRALCFVTVLMFCGPRTCELRAFRKSDDFDFGEAVIKVRRAANYLNDIGKVKTKAGVRDIPLPREVATEIKKWILAGPTSEKDLFFPNDDGDVMSYFDLRNNVFMPLMIAAGLTERTEKTVVGGRNKRPYRRAVHRPFFTMHDLRHVAVSLWIEQGATPKQVQTWAGHSSIKVTMDIYGHLWADRTGDTAILSAAARSVLEA